MSSSAIEYNSTGIPHGKLGMWVFLASEIMLFGAFISAYIVLRIGSPNFGVPPESVMGRPLATLNTFVLITSSATMVLALAAIQRDNIKQFTWFMVLTSVLGLTFLGIKAFEYQHKIHEGLTLSSGLFGSFYYTLTGLHALHMIGGLVFNTYVLIQGLRGVFNSHHHERVEYAGLYWHFVDLVWVILFPVFYLV
ncbi:MAG: Cytochrome c oxidase subunit 3 [Elusimicrobia bacterium]|nr:Cytochrome c oxidase subunit 3 [Elusimicrobiota bacterium]